MYYEVEIDLPEEDFLIPVGVFVKEGEDPVAKVRAAVEALFPGYEIPEFVVEDFV